MKQESKTGGIPLHVLIVEDSSRDYELICEQLKDAGYVLDVSRVEHATAFASALRANNYDIILSDFRLPDFDAFGALKIAIEICPEVPFICVSGSIGEETAIELMKLGAVDYVLKDRPDRLPFAVSRAINEARKKTELQKAEKQISLLGQAIKQSSVSIIITDAKGNIKYANPFFVKTSGYSLDEIIDHNPRILKSGYQSQKFYADLWDTILSGRNWQGELLNKKKNGTLFWEQSQISPVTDEKGNITHFIAVKEDITEKKKIREELIEAKENAEESDRLKTAFINNISHEIRTPLNSILGFGQILAESGLSRDLRMRYLDIVKASSQRLMQTVADYVDISMLVSGTQKIYIKAFVLDDLITEVLEYTTELRNEKPIEIYTSLPGEIKHLIVHSDKAQLARVLKILAENAVKFSQEGSITIGCKMSGNRLRFFVKDTGLGIARKNLQRIFDAFWQEDASNTRAYEGSGLGLSIARGLVELMGGSIVVDSEAGKGSVFSFDIPCEKEMAEEKLPKETQRVAPGQNTLVLVAEDDTLNREYLTMLLEEAGCDCLIATNGIEAIELCRQHADISFVLMDIKMPVLNGLEATKQIREINPELPVIALTAYAQAGDEHRVLSAGCNEYYAKPIRPEVVLKIVNKYAGKA